MHTLASARAWGAEKLKRDGTEASALASDLLLGFVISRDRIFILSHAEETLPDDSWRRYRSLVRRHAEGEPLQYLTGEREFYGLDFQVTPAVLIPRPETEFLVEKALQILQENFSLDPYFADIGTGSGCIAVSIASEMPEARGIATDISGYAIEIAASNAHRHRVAERIRFICTNLLDCFRREPVFNLILSNPPYVALEEYDTLMSCVKDHEPHQALFGGRDGLDVYRRLAPEVSLRLKPGGYFIVEIGAGQGDAVRRLMQDSGLIFEEIIEDLQGIPRCLVLRKNQWRGNG